MDSYHILGINRKTDDSEVRRAYLELVKLFPAERYPEKFSRINEAYNTLKDEESRIRYYLFNQSPLITSPFEAVMDNFSMLKKRTPLSLDKMKVYLRKCAK